MVCGGDGKRCQENGDLGPSDPVIDVPTLGEIALDGFEPSFHRRPMQEAVRGYADVKVECEQLSCSRAVRKPFAWIHAAMSMGMVEVIGRKWPVTCRKDRLLL
jgi:hypothetical protein